MFCTFSVLAQNVIFLKKVVFKTDTNALCAPAFFKMCQLLKAEFRVSLSDLPLITQGDYEGVFSFWRENWQSIFFWEWKLAKFIIH